MTSLPTSSWNPLPASCMPATSTVPLPAPASAAPCAEGALPHTVRSASPTPTEGGKCREFMQPFHSQFSSNDYMVWKDMCVHTHTSPLLPNWTTSVLTSVCLQSYPAGLSHVIPSPWWDLARSHP